MRRPNGWRSAGWLTPLALLALWQAASWAGWTNPLFFPPPTRLAAAAWRLAKGGTLETNLAATVARTLAAFLIGGVSGIAFGFLLGSTAGLRTAVRPMLSAALATPKITLLPLFMLLLGLGEPALLMPAAATCFVICAVHSMDAVMGLDRSYVDLARNYGAGSWEQVRYVYLPGSLPRLFTGLRVSLGIVLVLNLSAEMLSSENGLGAMIWMGWQTLAVDNLLVGVLTAALLGFAVQAMLDTLERRLIPWSRAAA